MGIHGIRRSTSVSKRVSLVQSAVNRLSGAGHLFSDSLRCIFCTGDDAGIEQTIIPSRIAPQKSFLFGLAWELRGCFQIGRPRAMWRTIPIWGELNDSGENRMLGWLTVFAMLALCSLLIMLGGTAAIIIPAVIASSLFAFLFFVFLLSSAIRGRP